MAKPTRVHILAKELGVTSKAIIDKCRAEGIEL
ncbi:MAG: translation initiation factor IF-2 N-terminal domain-containing protein, partial [Planctomycetota bacterium]